MQKHPKNHKSVFQIAISNLTPSVADAVLKYLDEYKIRENDVSEIRLRLYGVCALVVRGENRSLSVRLDKSDIKEIFRLVSGGAVFSHRDDVSRGFISLSLGVRVGVIGRARYEGGRVIGVDEVTSLVFRLPTGECSFARALYAEWRRLGGGMLICSPAGQGKTTAIRSLARLIGSGREAKRVVAVDERCELDPSEYCDAHVDILRGYRRAVGVDIAIRTMSAEVLIVDEISSSEDAKAMMSALGAGVTVIATAHADSLIGAAKRAYIRELILGGLFDSVCIIRGGAEFSYQLTRIGSDERKTLHGMGDI